MKASNKYLFNQVVDCHSCKWYIKQTDNYLDQCSHPNISNFWRKEGRNLDVYCIHIDTMRCDSPTIDIFCGRLGRYHEQI